MPDDHACIPEADRRRQQTEQNRDQIRRTLQADNLWTDSLALDLDELAQQKTFIDRLTEQMNQPGYQDTFTIPRKDGTMMPTLNPCTNTATRPWRSSSRAWNASVPKPSSASSRPGSLSDPLPTSPRGGE